MITAAAVNPGTLDRRMSLRYYTETRNARGGVLPAWMVGATVWARWLPQNSREFVAAAARYATLSAIVRIRYRADIAATWRVVIDGITYHVLGKPIELGRREYLDLYLETVSPAGGSADVLRQIFEVALTAGDIEKAIVFPTAFASAPAVMPQVTLIIPVGGDTFFTAARAGTLTAAGFTVDLGAAVPAAGYALSIDVTK